jgi:monothiol glutaredoxin
MTSHDQPSSPFRIAANEPRFVGSPVTDDEPGGAPDERIRRMVTSSPVFLFMKGEPAAPRCGFSANTVAILESLGVPYRTFDVLSDESIRAGAKTYAGWPTFPQVYVRGEFIGGNDILTEMYQAGELQAMVEDLR